ncbi:MAG TPA: site-specific integrase, partial [Candidatus Baltobacteraceae bacterium]|nr:site-specific integrase [Candidatus Baltobacteraceae bacterium]
GLAFKGTKSGKVRIISMHQDAFDALKHHRAEQNKHRLALGEAYEDHGLVFARPDGTPINPHAFGDAFRTLVKRADIPRIRLHDLRHTHVSLLLKSGASLKVVSERAGHATVGITGDIYAHALPGMDRTAADGFGSLLRKASKGNVPVCGRNVASRALLGTTASKAAGKLG